MKKLLSAFFFYLAISFFFFNLSKAEEIEILSDITGTGPQIENHYKVAVHYRGFLENGTEFDSSFKRNMPFIFQMGVRKVIPGWEIGIIDMKVGGKRKIKIPPELAYGKKGVDNVIPPNSNLIFDIEIISIQLPGYKNISPDELLSIKNKNLIIIDIRTENEWKKTGIIKGSKKITAFDFEGNFEPVFLKEFKLLTKKNDKNSKVVFISSKGDISSILANGFVEQLGYTKIYNLKGGIDEWINQGHKLK